MGTREGIFKEIDAERVRQDLKWGVQNHPIRDDSEHDLYVRQARTARQMCDLFASEGVLTWKDILAEEYHEAIAESMPQRQREELIQMIAVGVAMVECIDRNAEPDGTC